MGFSVPKNMSDEHQKLVRIAGKTFIRMTNKLSKMNDKDHVTNTDFEILLSTMVKIYIHEVIEKINDDDDRSGAMGSLFSCMLAVFIPEMEKDKAQAMFEEVFERWVEFQEVQAHATSD